MNVVLLWERYEQGVGLTLCSEAVWQVIVRQSGDLSPMSAGNWSHGFVRAIRGQPRQELWSALGFPSCKQQGSLGFQSGRAVDVKDNTHSTCCRLLDLTLNLMSSFWFSYGLSSTPKWTSSLSLPIAAVATNGPSLGLRRRTGLTFRRRDPSFGSRLGTVFGCGSKNRYPKWNPISGNMDQKLRNLLCLILSHTHFESLQTSPVEHSDAGTT